MDNQIRLNKFIAASGYSSRRKIDELIGQGRVAVNGKTISELGYKIDPEIDKITLDGEPVRASAKKIYIVLNKPKGVVTTVSDEKHRTTVIDLISIHEKIFPVGRLDYNTTGLLLLTNDGDLANKLMHPKSEIYKTYFVKLSRPLDEKHRLKLVEGIRIDGKKTAPSKIRFARKNRYDELYISIYEGRNRQVRNMFEHYGYFVDELERTEYADLHLDGLKEGQWKYLTAVEVNKLKALADKTTDAADSNLNDKETEKSSDEVPFVKEKHELKDRPYTRDNREHNKKGSSRKKKDGSFTRYSGDGKDRLGDNIKFDRKKSSGNKERSSFKDRDRDERKNKFPGRDRDAKVSEKWGFKKRMRDERDSRLGFGKADRTENERPSFSRDRRSGGRGVSDGSRYGKKNFPSKDRRSGSGERPGSGYGGDSDRKFQSNDRRSGSGERSGSGYGKSSDRKFQSRDRRSGSGERSGSDYGRDSDRKFQSNDRRSGSGNRSGTGYGKSADRKFQSRESRSGGGDRSGSGYGRDSKRNFQDKERKSSGPNSGWISKKKKFEDRESGDFKKETRVNRKNFGGSSKGNNKRTFRRK